MTVGLDTSFVLRLLTGQPAALARKALARFQDGAERGDKHFVNDVVAAETYYALQRHYGKTKAESLAALQALSRDRTFAFSDGFAKTISLPSLRNANPGFVDRLLVADYESRGYPTLSCEKSFKRLPNTETVKE